MKEEADFNYFDIHSHLNLEPIFSDRDNIVSEMKKEGVQTITVGTDLGTSVLAVKIAKDFDLYATVGIHPVEACAHGASPTEVSIFDFEKIKELAINEKVVAIGECGLDYFRISTNDEEIKSKQKELFLKHVELVLEVRKPLMIHARPSPGSMDAYEDVISILENYKLTPTDSQLKVNFHFFVGNLNIAKKIVQNGWTMSFDGPITFSRDYDEVIKFLPIGSFMAETDAPYASPVPFRGQIGNPTMVKCIYEKLAEIRGEDGEILREAINQTVKEFFSI